jgi:hypothetical protein
MLDDALVQAFEAATLDPTKFHHREHLWVAWCYLRALPLADALARYERHLRQLTVALGVREKFHATITWGYVLLLDDAMHHSPDASPAANPDLGFDALLARHPELLGREALDSWYEPAQLASAEARARFVLPRRA